MYTKKSEKGQCFDKIVCFNRQVTLFEEFVLLKEYEKREDVMEAKVTGKQQEKLEMQAKVSTVDSESGPLMLNKIDSLFYESTLNPVIPIDCVKSQI